MSRQIDDAACCLTKECYPSAGCRFGPVFPSSIQWSNAVGMWLKAAAVGNAGRAAARCERSQPMRRGRIVHMSIACRARSSRPPSAAFFFSAVSHFGQHDSRLAQAAQDHFFRPLGAPSFDPALQRSQLRVAGIGLRQHRCQSIHQFLGRTGRLGNQPAVDKRPRVGERINLCPPPVFGAGLFAMLGSGSPSFHAVQANRPKQVGCDGGLGHI